MNLNSEQKKFAYGKYTFNDRVRSILDFMDPVSKLDVKIEEVKKSSGSFELIIFILFVIIVGLIYYFRDFIGQSFTISPESITKIIIPTIVGLFVFAFVIYGFIYWSHITRDVDNDLNNFIIPFLKQIEKYIKQDTSIKLTTDLSQKLNKKHRAQTGTYADTLTIPWFSATLPFDNGITVFVDLTYVLSCFGKLESVRTGKEFKELKMKAEFRFVFPKKPSFNKFDYIGANYILDWSETENEYSLCVKTTEDCSVEFYRDADKTLGLIFDNNFCNDIIDEVYAKITGFTGYLLFKNTLSTDQLNENDYQDLENIKEKNEEFYGESSEFIEEQETQPVLNPVEESPKESSELEQLLANKVEESTDSQNS